MDAETTFEWPSVYVHIVPRLSGSLSAISSATIIYLILRSQTRLSSIYHQIMLCMSILDMTSTLSMALTTIPMPREMPQEKELGFEWSGGRYGNHTTCAAQGFFAVSGSIAMFGFNAMLCLYYACAVAFRMKEKHIRKYILPFIYGVPLVSGFGFAITLLFTGNYNPPTDFTIAYWCMGNVYPIGCNGEDNPCLRGNNGALEKARIAMSFIVFLGLFIMVTSLALVVNNRFRVHRLTQKFVKAAEEDNGPARILMASSPRDKLERIQVDTKVILLQSVAYIAAFSSGLIWVLLSVDGKLNMTNFKLSLFFIPIQGFLNLIVFLSHKVHNYKRIHRHSTVSEVLKLLFLEQVQEPCFVSRISMVIDDDVHGHIVDRTKAVLPIFRIMNEMDVEEYAHGDAIVDMDKVRGSDRDQNKNIQDPENDQSESFVDDKRVSKYISDKRDGISSKNLSDKRDGISSMSFSFQMSGLSVSDENDGNYGINRKSNMNYKDNRIAADSDTLGPAAKDDISRGGMSGLSGFSSILKSAAASFTTSVTPGSKIEKNDTK